MEAIASCLQFVKRQCVFGEIYSGLWGCSAPIMFHRGLMIYARNECSECRDNPRPGQRTCSACHNAYIRAWRKAHALRVDQRLKMNARSYAHVYLRRGKLVREPCEGCGDVEAQMHHEDYSKPLEVRWMCRSCHMAHHREKIGENK